MTATVAVGVAAEEVLECIAKHSGHFSTPVEEVSTAAWAMVRIVASAAWFASTVVVVVMSVVVMMMTVVVIVVVVIVVVISETNFSEY